MKQGPRHHLDRVLACLGLLLCAYLVYPALQSVHLEGFTAQTQSIALLQAIAPAVEHDPYLPRVTQFIQQTRSGVIDILSAVFHIFPGASDLAFRSLVLASFLALLAASIRIARRWGNTPSLFALFALILTPGIPETAFFFNDNMVSAALATVGLALCLGRPSRTAALLSGACCALAVLARLDAVFILPMILGGVLLNSRSARERWVTLALSLAGALLVLAASAMAHGFSLLDAFFTATRALAAATEPARWMSMRLFFFGLAVLPFLVIGGWLNFLRLKEQRQYLAIATFIVYPVLLIAFAPSVTEIRYIFPLMAPMVAMHAGNGLRWAYEKCTGASGWRSGLAWGAVILASLVMFLPSALVTVSDGPRSVVGRLWSPERWATWQASINQSMNRTRQLVARLDDGRQNIVLATHYNDDFYLRLRLMEAGFLPRAASSRHPDCKGFSLFTKGDSTVVHIRTHPQYQMAAVSFPYNAALQIAAALSCPALASSAGAFITTFGNYDWALAPEVYSFSADSFPGPANIEFSDPLAPRSRQSSRRYGLVRYRELTPDELAATLSKARGYLQSQAGAGPALKKEDLTIEQYAQAYRPLEGPTMRLLSGFGRPGPDSRNQGPPSHRDP